MIVYVRHLFFLITTTGTFLVQTSFNIFILPTSPFKSPIYSTISLLLSSFNFKATSHFLNKIELISFSCFLALSQSRYLLEFICKK
jgi:hypothetical protein